MNIDEAGIGDALPEVKLLVEAGPMQVTTLLTDDPNPIHFDPEAVERLGLGMQVVNQGVLNMAYPINALLEAVDGDPARIAWVRVRFLGNVFAGDEVVAGGQVVSEVEDGVREVEIWLDVVRGERALAGRAGLRCGQQ